MLFTNVAVLLSGLYLYKGRGVYLSNLSEFLTNAFNLIDGLDGLAAGSSVIIMVVMAAISYRADVLGCAIMSGALAGGCIGFL